MIKLNIFLFLTFGLIARLSASERASEYIQAMGNLKSELARETFLADRLTELENFNGLSHPFQLRAFIRVYQPQSSGEVGLLEQLKDRLQVVEALGSFPETMASQFNKFSDKQRQFFWNRATAFATEHSQDAVKKLNTFYKDFVRECCQNLIDFTQHIRPRDNEKDVCDTLKQLLARSQSLNPPVDFTQVGKALAVIRDVADYKDDPTQEYYLKRAIELSLADQGIKLPVNEVMDDWVFAEAADQDAQERYEQELQEAIKASLAGSSDDEGPSEPGRAKRLGKQRKID